LVGQDWPRAEDGARVSLWPLRQEVIPAIAQAVAARCFDPLLRKYVWDARGLYAGRPHSDLARLIPALADGLKDFLAARCLGGGDLADCSAEPVADAGHYFPDALPPPLPFASSGTPSLDVQRLGLAIGDDDDGGEIKRTLVHLVRDDPWLHAEWHAFVQSSLQDRSDQEAIGEAMAMDRATDCFIFRATRLDGKTPINVLMERQPGMSDRQRQ